MKKISRLIQLLPTALLKDFPTHLTGELATGILANWTAAWHPQLIAHANGAPIVHGARQTSVDEEDEDAEYQDFFLEDSEDAHFDGASDSDQLPEEIFAADFWRDSLVFVPEVSLEYIAEGFAAAAVGENAKLITGLSDRDEIIKRAFTLLAEDGEAPAGLADQNLPADDEAGRLVSVDDFYALAYAYLQIQLLTRKVRYSSNLDQAAFDQRLLEAAIAFAAGEDSKCNESINACYDLLLEEKNNYYPVKPALIDLVLTTPKTVGQKFKQEVESKHPNNILMTSQSIDGVDAETLTSLRNRLSENQTSILGGNLAELPDVLLSPETTVNQLRRGQNEFRDRLGCEIGIFMRRRFGLMTSLPNILDQFNFEGAIHTSLDGGKFPVGSMGTMRWAGSAGASILASGEAVVDASDPASFLDLGVVLGHQIDSSHEATCVLAHWPGQSHASMSDLANVVSRSPVLGEFATLDDHFETLYDPGYDDNFTSEEYETPFLAESLRKNSQVPLSRFVAYWKQYYCLHHLKCLLAMWAAAALTKKFPELPEIQAWLEKCDAWQLEMESFTGDWNDNSDAMDSFEKQLHVALNELVASFSNAAKESSGSDFSDGNSLLNPLFFTRRCETSSNLPSQPVGMRKLKQPFLVQHAADNRQHFVAETKATSFTPLQIDSPAVALRKEPAVLDGQKLQNEFFVVSVDPENGALKSIRFHGQRTNYASQRLVLRDKKTGDASTMVCDSFESTAISHISGQIKTSGRIMVKEEQVARFSQTFRLTRGRPVLEIDIEIEPTVDLGASKDKYFAHRLAWRDEACKIFGSSQFVRTELYTPRIESPNFVDIENLDYSLTLLAAGLPWHNRIQRRQLDTLLIVGQEKQRQFKMGLGINLDYPLKSAIDFVSPALVAPVSPSQTKQFFHVDSKNILVTDVRPVLSDAGTVNAFEFRFQETQDRGGDVTLHTPFAVSDVHRTNFHGGIVETYSRENSAPNQVKLTYAAGDYFQVRLMVE